ncbi:MAG: ABC-type transport auxiliary lipoprotein family protein [Candidatus Latescibacteria bacterium]|nr:ABC-type transport auxiliary lipoprotein family protein [Candidatus Latescibacterota bacterium]
MRPTKRARACGLLLLAACLPGCAQLLGGNAELPQRRWFKVNVEPMRNVLENSERPYPFQVQIKGFDVSRAYNRNELIVRRDQYELLRDNLHHWMERPGDMFTDVVKQYLHQADLFTYIGGDRDFYEHRPQYVLSGTIKALERFDSGDVWAAHLAMSMELVRQYDGKIIWQDDFDAERTVFFPEMKHTVAAFSAILAEQMKKNIRQIDFVFRNNQRVSTDKDGSPAIPTAGTAALQDTTLRIDTDASDYELIPGKLAP